MNMKTINEIKHKIRLSYKQHYSREVVLKYLEIASSQIIESELKLKQFHEELKAISDMRITNLIGDLDIAKQELNLKNKEYNDLREKAKDLALYYFLNKE
jgi:hypothetical protein